jgi:DNA-binding transcriptional MerR regulator
MSYSIAEAADLSGLTAHTLRYYERDGLMLDSVNRSSSGHRRYTDNDLTWIQMLTRLRTTGMPVREVKRYASLVRAGDGNEADRLALLVDHRQRVEAQLAAATAHLRAIDHKIGLYESKIEQALDLERTQSR